MLGIARREGNQRVYDLIERLFPAELLAERHSPREQVRHKLLSRYRGHGLLGASGAYELFAGTYFQRELGVEDGLPMGTATRKLALNELVEAGTLLPVEIDGVEGCRFIVAGEAALLRQAQAEVAAGTPPGGTRPRRRVPRRRSTRSSGTARSCGRSTTSTTSGRSTSRARSGAGATTSCRCSTATGSSAGSSCGSIARPGCWASSGVWWEDGFDPLADEAFAVALAEALDAHRAFAGSRRVAWPRTARLRPLVDAVKRARPEGRAAEGARSGLRPGSRAVSARSRRPERSRQRRPDRRPRAPVAGLVPARRSGTRRCGRRRARASSTVSSCSRRPSSTRRRRSAAGPASS